MLSAVLEIIHDSGWVHRDISDSNIYIFEGRGLLGDLEYAKSVHDDPDYHVRTVNMIISFFFHVGLRDQTKGTLYFMAAEVMSHRYLFVPEPESDGEDEVDLIALRKFWKRKCSNAPSLG